jgi:hypothetical protein
MLSNHSFEQAHLRTSRAAQAAPLTEVMKLQTQLTVTVSDSHVAADNSLQNPRNALRVRSCNVTNTNQNQHFNRVASLGEISREVLASPA